MGKRVPGRWRPRRDRALVAALGLLLAVSAAAAAPSGTDRFDLIDAYVRRELDGSRIPGLAYAIVDADRTVHARGLGHDGRGRPIGPDTPFWIGSNTKSFTALAVRQLAEAGEIDLDAPVRRYLPQFRVADEAASSAITVRHLLNQTSGFARADGIKPVLEERVQSLEEAVADLGTVQLNRPVGQSYQYSNLNFVVLGLLVQTVGGRPWADHVQARIFDPLGMTSSATTLEAARARGLTATHRLAFGLPVPAEGKYLPGLAPTGYLYATAGDMARYLAMVLDGGAAPGARLLSEAGVAAMLAPATNEAGVRLQGQDFTFRYGEGWFVGPFGAAPDARWHQGALPDFTAWMVVLPDSDQALVVLMNAGSQLDLLGANRALSRIPVGIVNLLRGEAPPSGPSMNRSYLAFDALALALLALSLWTLARVARRPAGRPRGLALAGAAGALAWELGVGLGLLLSFPAVLGMGWTATLRSVPDLAVVALALGIVWLATGLLRLQRLARAGRTRSPLAAVSVSRRPI